MKRQLIEMRQQHLIQCDNPDCEYVIENPTGDPHAEIKDYIDMPCPKCEENLLTQQDYDDAMRMLRLFDKINKYFSWVTYLFPKSKKGDVYFHTHNGVKTFTKK